LTTESHRRMGWQVLSTTRLWMLTQARTNQTKMTGPTNIA
jgi:hypothetical protein